MNKGFNIKKRSKARKFAMQALYTWNISDNSIGSVIEYYMADRNPSKFDSEFFTLLVSQISSNLEQIDQEISTHTKIKLESISPIELSILRVGIFELINCPETPMRAAINEGLEMAKTFGAVDSHKFINAILDKTAIKYRTIEVEERNTEKSSSV